LESGHRASSAHSGQPTPTGAVGLQDLHQAEQFVCQLRTADELAHLCVPIPGQRHEARDAPRTQRTFATGGTFPLTFFAATSLRFEEFELYFTNVKIEYQESATGDSMGFNPEP
jgi:hypothetical protein